MNKVSVVAPVYNVEEYLEERTDSILNQTYPNIGLVLADDGSIDKSRYTCDQYALTDDRIHVIHKKDSGASESGSTGISTANGEFICFVDSDDRIDSNMIECFLNLSLSNQASICISSHYFEDVQRQLKIDKYSKKQATSLLLTLSFPASMCLGLYKTSLFIGKCFSKEVHHWEDFLFQYRVVADSEVVLRTNQCFYHYRQRKGSANHSGISQKVMSCMKIPWTLKSASPSIQETDIANVYSFMIFQCFMAYVRTDIPDNTYRREIIFYIKSGLSYVLFSTPIPLKYKLSLVLFIIYPYGTYSLLHKKCGMRMINNTLMKLSFSSFIASIGILFSRTIKRDFAMLFSSFLDYTDNAYALLQYISESEQYDHYLKVWVLSDKTDYEVCKKDILSKNSNTRAVFRFSLLAFWYFFRAKFVFCTHGLYSFWDISQRDKLINLWHGMPLKRIGSTNPAKHGVNKTRAHYLVATSEIFRELMPKSFNNSDLGRVLLIGQSRNDLLFQKTDFFSKRSIQRTDYCSVGIWLPTFRTSIIGETRTGGISTNDTTSFLNIADLQDLNIFLSEIKILLVIKLHPMGILQVVDFPLFTNIMVVKQNDFSFQLYPLLGATDLLLTDYSPVWIDYDILDRPMGFVMNDIDKYQKSRGLAFDNISEVLPGPTLSDLESLKFLLKAPEIYKKETQNRFSLYKDDQVCYRLIHIVDKLSKNDLIF